MGEGSNEDEEPDNCIQDTSSGGGTKRIVSD